MSDRRFDRPYRGLTTLRTLLGGIVVFLVGLSLLYLSSSIPALWVRHEAWHSVVNDLGGLLIISVGLGAIWELVGKRSFAREVLEAAKLSGDISLAGLRSIGTNWLEDADWAELFSGVSDLEIFVAYGQSWRTFNLARLEEFSRRRGAHLRLYLPDPNDAQSIATLARRFAMTSEVLIGHIDETRAGYESLRSKGGTIEIFFYPGDRTFSLYRFGDTAVITLYRHKHERSATIPTIVCRSGGSLYDFVISELEAIRSASRSAA